MEFDIEIFKCSKCKNFPDKPFESICCGKIYCRTCSSRDNFLNCEFCGIMLKFRESMFAKHLMGKAEENCKYCNLKYPILKSIEHNFKCQEKLFNCTIKKCSFMGKRIALLEHVKNEHSKEMLIMMENYIEVKNEMEVYMNSSKNIIKPNYTKNEEKDFNFYQKLNLNIKTNHNHNKQVESVKCNKPLQDYKLQLLETEGLRIQNSKIKPILKGNKNKLKFEKNEPLTIDNYDIDMDIDRLSIDSESKVSLDNTPKIESYKFRKNSCLGLKSLNDYNKNHIDEILNFKYNRNNINYSLKNEKNNDYNDIDSSSISSSYYSNSRFEKYLNNNDNIKSSIKKYTNENNHKEYNGKDNNKYTNFSISIDNVENDKQLNQSDFFEEFIEKRRNKVSTTYEKLKDAEENLFIYEEPLKIPCNSTDLIQKENEMRKTKKLMVEDKPIIVYDDINVNQDKNLPEKLSNTPSKSNISININKCIKGKDIKHSNPFLAYETFNNCSKKIAINNDLNDSLFDIKKLDNCKDVTFTPLNPDENCFDLEEETDKPIKLKVLDFDKKNKMSIENHIKEKNIFDNLDHINDVNINFKNKIIEEEVKENEEKDEISKNLPWTF